VASAPAAPCRVGAQGRAHVGATKIFDVFSDPDTPYTGKEDPNATIKGIVSYDDLFVSRRPGFGAASSIVGSRLRLGLLNLSGPEAKAMRTGPHR
jgi:hypothetical protein